MHTDLSPVSIADDGDLGDVRLLLDRLAIGFVDAWEGKADTTTLRISNPRHACERGASSSSTVKGCRPFHIVILDEESQSVRRELKSGNVDFIVQRPVHPAALRLLILHALYSGPERRCRARVAMDAEIKIGSGLLRRTATLTQLSDRGCGLISDRELEVGDHTTVAFPRGLTGGGALSIEGRVAASNPLEGTPTLGYELSIAFGPAKVGVREQLRALMASRGIGAAALRPRPGKVARSDPAPQSVSSAAETSGAADESGDRRGAPRRGYRRPVLASTQGAVHTIIGRDLSTTGMRVAPDERLKKGDEFKLVIYGSANRPPLIVKAAVVRNDGPNGCALRFIDVGTSAAATLKDMVGSLPRLGDSAKGPNLVVSEVLEDA